MKAKKRNEIKKLLAEVWTNTDANVTDEDVERARAFFPDGDANQAHLAREFKQVRTGGKERSLAFARLLSYIDSL